MGREGESRKIWAVLGERCLPRAGLEETRGASFQPGMLTFT